jgi:hypothetical protein
VARLHRAAGGGIGPQGPVVTKGDGVWRGKANLPYLPRDPERRANLLRDLGIELDQLLTEEDMK